MPSEEALRRALRMSRNKHWFGRLCIALWALLIVAFAMLEVSSAAAQAMRATGPMGFWMMCLLGALAAGLVMDSVLHDLHLGAFQAFLMVHRHQATMVMALVLALEGAELAIHTRHLLLFAPFVTLSLLCCAVTYVDLYARNKERCTC